MIQIGKDEPNKEMIYWEQIVGKNGKTKKNTEKQDGNNHL